MNSSWFTPQRYLKEEVIVFGTASGHWRALANVTPGYPVVSEGQTFLTTEGMYHAGGFPENPLVRTALAQARTGEMAKHIKQQNLSFRRPDWDQVKFEWMQNCLRWKLSQHWGELSQLLTEVGERRLVEVSPVPDARWGAVPEGEWLIGCNWLGRLWAEVWSERNHVQN